MSWEVVASAWEREASSNISDLNESRDIGEVRWYMEHVTVGMMIATDDQQI